MKRIVSAFLCFVLLVSFAACAKKESAPEQSGADLFVGTGKVAYLVLEKEGRKEGSLGADISGKLDAFAQENDLTVYYQETKLIDEYAPYLLTIASGGGTTVIVALGSAMTLAVDEAAAMYPDETFLFVEGGEVNRPNVFPADKDTFTSVLESLL